MEKQGPSGSMPNFRNGIADFERFDFKPRPVEHWIHAACQPRLQVNRKG
jgi:hypothetical protein